MNRSTWMILAVATFLAAPVFAVDVRPAKVKKEESKAEQTPEATVVPTAEPTKEAAKEEANKEETKATEESKPTGHKSATLATTLAFIPGVAVHGVGHMYAGSWMKGCGLLAIEGAAIWMGARYYENAPSDFEKVFKTSNNQVPEDLGPVYSRVGILVVATSAFIFTWVEDIMGASTAVGVYNKKQDQAAQASLRLAPSGDGLAMVYQRRF